MNTPMATATDPSGRAVRTLSSLRLAMSGSLWAAAGQRGKAWLAPGGGRSRILASPEPRTVAPTTLGSRSRVCARKATTLGSGSRSAHRHRGLCATASTFPGPPASAFPLAANFPTALAFAPDGRLFWTERAGNVMVYENGSPRVFARVGTVTTEPGGGYSERGLLGLALSPTFGTDHFVYAFYSDANFSTQHVVRWTDSGGTGTAPTTILTFPAGGDCCHKGGRLAFGPTDGKLYVTLGEEHNPDQAQSVGSPLGKVLRY